MLCLTPNRWSSLACVQDSAPQMLCLTPTRTQHQIKIKTLRIEMPHACVWDIAFEGEFQILKCNVSHTRVRHFYAEHFYFDLMLRARGCETEHLREHFKPSNDPQMLTRCAGGRKIQCMGVAKEMLFAQKRRIPPWRDILNRLFTFTHGVRRHGDFDCGCGKRDLFRTKETHVAQKRLILRKSDVFNRLFIFAHGLQEAKRFRL